MPRTATRVMLSLSLKKQGGEVFWHGCGESELWMQMMAGKSIHGSTVGQRSQLSACAAWVFSAHVLLREDLLDVSHALRILSESFGPLLWGLPQSAASHLKAPPPEMFHSPSPENLLKQYEALRDLARRISTAAEYQDQFDDLEEWQEWDERLHAALMRSKYQHCKNCWHVLRLYHRLYAWGFSSESVCESATSIMRYVEKKHSVGRSFKTQSLVNSTLLRFYGVDGRPESWPCVLKIMHSYFSRRKQGASSLHFFVCQKTRRRRQLQAKEGVLGPSRALQSHREKERQRGSRFRWLSKASLLWNPAKKVSKSVIKGLQMDDTREPDDFFPEVWDVVLPALQNLTAAASAAKASVSASGSWMAVGM